MRSTGELLQQNFKRMSSKEGGGISKTNCEILFPKKNLSRWGQLQITTTYHKIFTLQHPPKADTSTLNMETVRSSAMPNPLTAAWCRNAKAII